jgi:cytoskeletal protein RodZ
VATAAASAAERVTGILKISLGVLALFTAGLMASGALADGDPFAPVTAVTSLVSGTDTTGTGTTATDTSSAPTDTTGASSTDATSSSTATDTTSSTTDTSSTPSDTSSTATDTTATDTTSSASTDTTTAPAPTAPPVSYIVTFNDNVPDAQRSDIAAAGGTPGDAISVLSMYSVTFPAGEDQADHLCAGDVVGDQL